MAVAGLAETSIASVNCDLRQQRVADKALPLSEIQLSVGHHRYGPCGMLRVRAKTVDGDFWQPKTKRNRVIPISDSLLPILSAYQLPRDREWFFPSEVLFFNALQTLLCHLHQAQRARLGSRRISSAHDGSWNQRPWGDRRSGKCLQEPRCKRQWKKRGLRRS